MENNQSLGVDVTMLPWDECCGGVLFTPHYMFKRMSPLQSPTGQEEHMRLEIITCNKCGKIPSFMEERLPDFILSAIPDEMKHDVNGPVLTQ